MIKAVRGTRDLLPPDTALWNFVEQAARDVFRAYNFHEIRTPVFEETQLFARSVGEETDIVSKEMFTWVEGRDTTELTLQAEWLEKKAKDDPNIGWLVPARLPNLRHLPDLELRPPSGASTFVAFRRSASLDSVRQLAQYGNGWCGMFDKQPILKIVTAVTPSGLVREEAKRSAIEIETIDLQDVEPPQSLTLRPENTAGVVRAYIEHKLWDGGLNKLFYIGPQFRRERPQKGRYRQFYQIGAEVIGPSSAGSESPARDAEVIELLAAFLDRIGITGWTLELNSVGCAQDRPRFNEALRNALESVVSKMCADCQRRADTNPLRVFDCKVPADQPIIETLPRISHFLDEGCRTHFEQVKEILTAVGVPFTINDRLVRGLDYYTRTAFEFTHGALGAQNAILGGGRYDGLSESLGGPPAPGIGFAIGEDRLVMSLNRSAEEVIRKPDVYIAPLGAGMNSEGARLARELRRQDVVVELGDENFRLKKSFEAATKAGAKFILIVGEDEVKAGAFAVKNLTSGEQVSVPRQELAQKIQSGR